MKKTVYALILALTAVAGVANANALTVRKVDPYTDGAKEVSVYTDGQKAGDKFDPYTEGAKFGPVDVYTDGGDRQADTYGYLSKLEARDPYTDGQKVGDKFDPYTDGAWGMDANYPRDSGQA